MRNDEIIFGKWISLHKATKMLKERFMGRDPSFVLDNWDCKYINARIDMRTGVVILFPGNTHEGWKKMDADGRDIPEIRK